ncbi:hypothetical protein J6590_036238 [Homalodisca vitripennis]|nr:hypothetical protein J6590_036238 [Homalodisca vitripennis]
MFLLRFSHENVTSLHDECKYQCRVDKLLTNIKPKMTLVMTTAIQTTYQHKAQDDSCDDDSDVAESCSHRSDDRQTTYQHKAQDDSCNDDSDVAESCCHRSDESDECSCQCGVAKHSSCTDQFRKPPSRQFCADVAPEETAYYDVLFFRIPVKPYPSVYLHIKQNNIIIL